MNIDNEEKERRAKIVVDDCGGIQFAQEAFYIHSILYSAGRCVEAFERYEQLKREDISPTYLVAIVQEAVGHAAALSRYFWPTEKHKKSIVNQLDLRSKRGEKLRTAFSLDESSVLFNRDLRNAWEHFDERLDQYLLTHMAGAAALSRYFWPTEKHKKSIVNQLDLRSKLGEKLRTAFSLDESSVLFNRDLRNAWEHFDERLDQYLLTHMAGMFFPGAVIADHTEADNPINHVFKLLDVENECLVLMNQKYFFAPIFSEVTRVFELAMTFDQNGSRLP
ncbi:hypothetical protein VVS316_03122 [Vibrio vulnificus]|nr:hypothetical protein [Vibrio vulnificus]OJI46505.1 hypothetical protein VVS316_03122 [Vibrio vulnificus]